MFDILTGLTVKCPVCGKNRDRQWQTKYWSQKQLSFEISTHGVGETVEDKDGVINCVGNCPICKTKHTVDVIIEDYIITKKYINLQH